MIAKRLMALAGSLMTGLGIVLWVMSMWPPQLDHYRFFLGLAVGLMGMAIAILGAKGVRDAEYGGEGDYFFKALVYGLWVDKRAAARAERRRASQDGEDETDLTDSRREH